MMSNKLNKLKEFLNEIQRNCGTETIIKSFSIEEFEREQKIKSDKKDNRMNGPS